MLRARLLWAAAQQRPNGVVIVSVGACARAFNLLDPVDPATGNHHGWLTNGKTCGGPGMRRRIRRVRKRASGNGPGGNPSTAPGAYLTDENQLISVRLHLVGVVETPGVC